MPVTVLDFAAGDTADVGDGSYIVTAGGETTKLEQHYTQETWTDANGLPYFVFAPINACSGCGEIYLLEYLKGSVKQEDLGPRSRSYSSTTTRSRSGLSTRCRTASRTRGALTDTDLLTDDVLPVVDGEPATSCIVEAHQTVRGDGSPGGAFVDAEFWVYSSYDGGRGMG